MEVQLRALDNFGTDTMSSSCPMKQSLKAKFTVAYCGGFLLIIILYNILRKFCPKLIE